jgi:hypothetical protein
VVIAMVIVIAMVMGMVTVVVAAFSQNPRQALQTTAEQEQGGEEGEEGLVGATSGLRSIC